ncbi:hypothetical protein H4R33_005305 [Dimargaris cristalligena]|nr:hypothetical protein H4R33_005305 [Dimargaris cristalligena]
MNQQSLLSIRWILAMVLLTFGIAQAASVPPYSAMANGKNDPIKKPQTEPTRPKPT